jgi:hypothetical protein
VKRGLLIGVLVICAVCSGAGSARAAVPCRDRIFNDWYRDGRISSRYPVSCYRDALRHIPPDAQIYSSLETDIKAALQAALDRLRGNAKVPNQVGHGLPATTAGATKAAVFTLGSTDAKLRVESSANRAVAAPPVAGASTSAPLPILVLGGVALALAAAGSIGAGVRHVRSRG